MYFCVLDPATPVWVKAIAAAALAYFILPLDAVPDLLPIVGLSDDASVLAAAFAAISTHVTRSTATGPGCGWKTRSRSRPRSRCTPDPNPANDADADPWADRTSFPSALNE